MQAERHFVFSVFNGPVSVGLTMEWRTCHASATLPGTWTPCCLMKLCAVLCYCASLVRLWFSADQKCVTLWKLSCYVTARPVNTANIHLRIVMGDLVKEQTKGIRKCSMTRREHVRERQRRQELCAHAHGRRREAQPCCRLCGLAFSKSHVRLPPFPCLWNLSWHAWAWLWLADHGVRWQSKVRVKMWYGCWLKVYK